MSLSRIFPLDEVYIKKRLPLSRQSFTSKTKKKIKCKFLDKKKALNSDFVDFRQRTPHFCIC
ncbi:hypothetical protein IWX76_003321 [Pedobacter sp. CAN_A7]